MPTRGFDTYNAPQFTEAPFWVLSSHATAATLWDNLSAGSNTAPKLKLNNESPPSLQLEHLSDLGFKAPSMLLFCLHCLHSLALGAAHGGMHSGSIRGLAVAAAGTVRTLQNPYTRLGVFTATKAPAHGTNPWRQGGSLWPCCICSQLQRLVPETGKQSPIEYLTCAQPVLTIQQQLAQEIQPVPM